MTKVDDWVKTEQAKHRLCACGCGEEIIIIRNHHSRGIPKHINHHISDEIRYKLNGRIPWNKGIIGYKTKPCSEETKRKISDSHMGLRPSEETLEKLRQSHKGYKSTDKAKRNMSEAQKGRKHSEETKKKMGKWHKNKKHSEESKLKMSKSAKNRPPISDETRMKLSKNNSGENNAAWLGGISFLPYCHKFNNQLKERIRDRDNRTCQGCGLNENGRRLAVHHIHYDKENCYPDLIALCNSCHMKTNTNRQYWEEYYTNILETRGLLNWS